MIKSPLLRFVIGAIVAIFIFLALFLLFGKSYVTSNKAQGILTPIPTEVAKMKLNSMDSADSSKTLVMQVEDLSSDKKTYTFFVKDNKTEQQVTLFTKTSGASSTFSIPFNAWSPDGKYVWIEEKNGNNTDAFVFNASGAPFPTGDQYFDVSTLFGKRITNNTFSEVTGWASETLLIVDTVNASGEKSTSYWFEVPSQAVIPLATQF